MMLHVAVLDHGTMWLVVCNVITTNREINLVLVENHNSFGVQKKNWRNKCTTLQNIMFGKKNTLC